LTTVDAMAAHYLREIHAVQAHGPYHFCAFSAGSVALSDAYAPGYPKLLPGTSQTQYKLSVHRNTLRLHGFAGQVNYLWRRASKRLEKIFSAISSALLKLLHLPLPRLAHYNEIAAPRCAGGGAFGRVGRFARKIRC